MYYAAGSPSTWLGCRDLESQRAAHLPTLLTPHTDPHYPVGTPSGFPSSV